MHKAGFVNIFGKPNAGKSTLLNALLGEKLAIVTPKVQTTRQRIRGILNGSDYQIVFSDTPGIIDPRYKLHEKMMSEVKAALEDADVALLIADATENAEGTIPVFSRLQLKVPALLVLNKTDTVTAAEVEAKEKQYQALDFLKEIIPVAALHNTNTDRLLESILRLLPEGPSFFPEDELTDKPMRFFVAEMIREKILLLYEEEIPYHTAVLVTEFREKTTLTKISAQIIVSRESQKAILLGEKGTAIRKLGTRAREDIEQFLNRKVFLELFVKVRNKWRDNENYLREYGY